ncbi:hypothetical protein PUN28_019921 [Cardiocondyla obscurior]|uniref:Uncharacterized protein n=1 Tax=Cardiocondyla obscurior TaxID=286306 RepID=A0AAW2EDW8_9HYME
MVSASTAATRASDRGATGTAKRDRSNPRPRPVVNVKPNRRGGWRRKERRIYRPPTFAFFNVLKNSQYLLKKKLICLVQEDKEAIGE